MEGTDPKSLPLAELGTRLAGQLSRLVRQELALARAELFARGRQAVLGGGLLAMAATLALGASAVLIAAAVMGVAEALPAWAAALIVGGALLALAGLLFLAGRARLARATPPLPLTTASIRRLGPGPCPGHAGRAAGRRSAARAGGAAVSPIRTAAEREEQAELIMLREQADRTAGEVAQTFAELTRRIDVLRRPGKPPGG